MPLQRLILTLVTEALSWVSLFLGGLLSSSIEAVVQRRCSMKVVREEEVIFLVDKKMWVRSSLEVGCDRGGQRGGRERRGREDSS